MACVAVNSLVRTIELELLQPLPRPIVRQNQLIPGNEKLIQNLHQKLGDLIEVLDENRMDGIQAIKDLETKLRDVAFRVEDEIEFQIYDDPSIASHFDKRVWVVVSQHHNKLQMLADLLKSTDCVDIGTQEDQLAQKLYQNLMHQRYFVVIDDIWSFDAWNSINACFPDNANGSRVLLTTRSAQVATSIGSNNNFSHQKQLLDQTESWNLFREKASKSGYAEFEAIGRPIVEKCK